MSNIKWPFLGLAVLAAACLMGIGVAIGEQSWIGALFSVIILLGVMGFGFSYKAKLRRAGKL
ncbi:YlaF family protein [Domibacillus robiginosus]|uniref:YlaF family protein n=1 Tax=Domibacillus robiginosus TaxID=1071054 RepID=UPI00067D8135|nr:YlaF family protein [Domibacillus robiginosus]